MAKAIKQQPTKASAPAKTNTPKSMNDGFLFDRENYLIMIAGVVVIFIGFALMSGGQTTDPNVFPKEEIYSFRRITLAPITVIIGFCIEIVAILKRPKTQA